MPLETTTYDLSETLDELVAEAEGAGEDAAGLVSDAEDDRTIRSQLQTEVNEGQQTQRFAGGVEWALEEYGDVEITLGALTNGERHLAKDIQSEIGDFEGTYQLAFIAVGTRDAPWCEHDSDVMNQDAVLATVQRIRDMHPAFADWLEAEISDIGVPSDAGNAFERSLKTHLQQRQTTG